MRCLWLHLNWMDQDIGINKWKPMFCVDANNRLKSSFNFTWTLQKKCNRYLAYNKYEDKKYRTEFGMLKLIQGSSIKVFFNNLKILFVNPLLCEKRKNSMWCKQTWSVCVFETINIYGEHFILTRTAKPKRFMIIGLVLYFDKRGV